MFDVQVHESVRETLIKIMQVKIQQQRRSSEQSFAFKDLTCYHLCPCASFPLEFSCSFVVSVLISPFVLFEFKLRE